MSTTSMTMTMAMTTSMTMSSATPTTTIIDEFTPGQNTSKGIYVPTKAERMAYQAARVSWYSQVRYGYYTLGYLASLLVIFIFIRLMWYFKIRYRVRLQKRFIAILRLLTYPRLPSNSWIDSIWTFGPLGQNILLFAGLIFVSCLTWINKYYYFPAFIGAAPLFLRAEWIAMATLPFVYVLGTKRNIISILTGISHEKLQVLHQGLAFNFTYMSLVHSIAAIVRAYSDYGFPRIMDYNGYYASGFVALAPLCVLFLGALPPFRKMFYEAFYWIHIIMATVFLGALFWHSYALLDSNAYMISTIVLFLFAVLHRLVKIIMGNPFLHLAAATVISDEDDNANGNEIIHLSIPTCTIKWEAGQHVFLRFLAVRPLESHPFTIAAIPLPLPQGRGQPNKKMTMTMMNMEFILRPQYGFTRSLYEQIRKGQKEFAVLIDGPYGDDGLTTELTSFDNVVLCAAGTGVAWTITALMDLCKRKQVEKQNIKMIWAVRYHQDLAWFEDKLQEIIKAHPHIQVDLYVTRHETDDHAQQDKRTEGTGATLSNEQAETSTSSISDSDSENISSNEKGVNAIQIFRKRPDIPQILADHFSKCQGSIAVATCGTQGFLINCANSVASAQVSLVKGGYPEVSEIYLKSESFGW